MSPELGRKELSQEKGCERAGTSLTEKAHREFGVPKRKKASLTLKKKVFLQQKTDEKLFTDAVPSYM